MTLPFAAEAAACRAAQQAWSRLSIRQRLQPIRELRHLLVERADEICQAVAADIGRPAVEVVGSELLPAAAALRFLEQEAARILKPRKIRRRLRPTWLFGCRDAVYRRPWGVVGVIGTWNYPIFLNAGQIAQALAAGNGVLWKPSENAPRTAELTHRLFLESGIPANLLATLPATREGGAQLAEADADYFVFTGSERVGRNLARRLGERLIPSTLELSGCDAMFVLEDADLDLAARSAWFGFTLNRGQTCIAVRRIFVHRSLAADFVKRLRPLLDDAEPMPLVTPGLAAQANRITGNSAIGGAVRPTLIENATVEMAICREAAFAPIAALIPFDTVESAVSLAARCPFGLAASIFTKDTQMAEQLAGRIAAGHVAINDVIAPTAHPATPFGGRGASGWGCTQGAEGLLAMTSPQAVSVRKWTAFRPHVDDSIAADPATLDVLQGLLRASHGRGFRGWLGGIRQLYRAIRKKRGMRNRDAE
jgi:acyl-CoA reductase-like NAD-dependent aldehyde dehydrogenase